MCGICGIVGGGSKELLIKMCDRLTHRGPDSQGYYSHGNAHLAMRRLSIIDLAGGDQPVFNEDRSLLITFNGEVYNYRELRAELVKKGHRFSSHSDTEVVLHAYEEYGVECLGRFNGMYAIAIWDTKKNELLLARDPIGIKPLYYLQNNGCLAWASEIKSLRTLPFFSDEMNVQALNQYFQFLYVPSPNTIYSACKKLQPGHCLKWSNGILREEAFWKPSGKTIGKIDPQEAVGETRRIIRDAVSRCMVADVPIGAFLSGGLDSSTIVAFMSEQSSQPVKTFTMGYARHHGSYNEWEKARLVAKTFKTEHREFEVKPEMEEILPQLVRGFDEPFADSSAIPTFLVSRETSREVKVALSGIGGDEAFGGYPRYLGARLSEPWGRIPLGIRKRVARFARLLPQSGSATNYAGRLARFLEGCVNDPFQRYLGWVSFSGAEQRRSLLNPSFYHDCGQTHFGIWNQSPYSDYLRKIQFLDTSTYLCDDLLCMGDRMSMSNSLELRVPFCDHTLVDFALSLPPNLKLQGFSLKSLFKKAMREILPDTLINSRKQGFMVPLTSWLSEDLRNLIDDVLSPAKIRAQEIFQPGVVASLIQRHRAGDVRLAHTLWALLVFQVWMEEKKKS